MSRVKRCSESKSDSFNFVYSTSEIKWNNFFTFVFTCT